MRAAYCEFIDMRPAAGFPVILADPPWLFENRSEKGEAKNPNQHYDCMPVEMICALPVEIRAAQDCALFMWATWPTIFQAGHVIEAWGFEYAGLAWEWIKWNPETKKYAFGPGYGTRKNLEPCLLATKGNPSLRIDESFFGHHQAADGVHSVRDFFFHNPHNCIRSRRREHSRKPDEQYERIETMFEGPYLELFARRLRPGWTVWGKEARERAP